ncbi:putative mitochondrial protein phosphatase 2C [Leptomonas pyrrhocoris]|uniref:Protein phosphatase n=1 Tax=Leptomonas pyrrhocoris TaxID=157538 RepID=A0A0M9G4H9_LEPPY|nr:putative mitochondrial protein phosphatase 2C [Leptomonas pyrrhocoris]XP_015660533.1 putative mitochondrial protein phosphatase 2C [Leptomonas pyrrhocoris]KPA82093.1 putative mitochondrial protein phosphatase 2C [Leptomonas pyrrhocoris]KPA82094.1 putative mitochondrial protein phosphatase 2C [Leptomonas pyrrhocoris]|eukprot:XP_015660532.1 putative mitochondrial protein phosphatase 2C [Leptomonas pyrrhocoris]
MLSISLMRRCVARAPLRFGRRGACAISHPKKAYRGGEDAYLSHPYAVGVADGVGGYASLGIDPAMYTRNVMRFALECMNADGETPKRVSALDALNYGYRKAREAQQPGGCPVALATIMDDFYASILNLGDCGVVVLRQGRLLYRTEMQQHSFNCPFQLPEDPPSAGEQAKLEIRAGDVFLCVSDGVLDNVELDRLLLHMSEVSAVGCGKVAAAIAEEAFRNAQDPRCFSPFAKHAAEAGYKYTGGKLDDITALVAQVTPDDDEDGETCPPLITQLLGIDKS